MFDFWDAFSVALAQYSLGNGNTTNKPRSFPRSDQLFSQPLRFVDTFLWAWQV